jgi:hypothetical protein
MEIDRMELPVNIDIISQNEVLQEDKRNTKKMMLPTDAICAQCGVIFNSVYEDECVICEDNREIKNEIKEDIKEEIKDVEKPVIRFVEDKKDSKDKDKKDSKDKDKEGDEVCEHTDFIIGRQSVDLRILLDFHVEDLRALCEIHGCSEGGSRGKMVVNIMRQLHPNLDKRIDELLVRKMIVRNRKKFRFWKNIEDAINRAKKPGKIKIIDAEDCLDITEIPKNRN